MLSEHDQEFLDAVYNEMMNFSAMDTGVINNILDVSEDNDEMYEHVVRWFRSSNTGERKYFEEQMANLLGRVII